MMGEFVRFAYTLIIGLDDQLRRFFYRQAFLVLIGRRQRVHDDRERVVQDEFVVRNRPGKLAYHGKTLSLFDLGGLFDRLEGEETRPGADGRSKRSVVQRMPCSASSASCLSKSALALSFSTSASRRYRPARTQFSVLVIGNPLFRLWAKVRAPYFVPKPADGSTPNPQCHPK
jgi:hypothetical protein